MALSVGNCVSVRLDPNSSIDSRWTSPRKRTLDPHAQLAGSVAKASTWLEAPQILQVNETTLKLSHRYEKCNPFVGTVGSHLCLACRASEGPGHARRSSATGYLQRLPMPGLQGAV